MADELRIAESMITVASDLLDVLKAMAFWSDSARGKNPQEDGQQLIDSDVFRASLISLLNELCENAVCRWLRAVTLQRHKQKSVRA
ncbi:hypothetical protein Spb1_12320 [Planctopirus ephydatiae]|uniref:Uncharacterized protein n=1 Tax=Planctopirus ephydatiae TaxID=2528019 RepID=A0A518GLC2_9PLAN|nr:hypothetical protein Spb1_12320 [Planctopirus ephydatiae]